jgi:hypothetical protein
MENAAVDSGSLLIIDPCYLFTTDEWRDLVIEPAFGADGHLDYEKYRRQVLIALKKKVGLDQPVGLENLGAVIDTGGDGRFPVIQTEEGILIGNR